MAVLFVCGRADDTAAYGRAPFHVILDPEASMFAHQPEDLHQLFATHVNARDVDGLVELHEPGAVAYDLQGNLLDGAQALRAMLTSLVSMVDHIDGETRR